MRLRAIRSARPPYQAWQNLAYIVTASSTLTFMTKPVE
jgi:hypothetical protein